MAANYLTVAQIYLKSNPLLRETAHRRGHQAATAGALGTSPGLSMIYTLFNRLIGDTGTAWLYVSGPGRGGPALVWQFSTPGGVPRRPLKNPRFDPTRRTKMQVSGLR